MIVLASCCDCLAQGSPQPPKGQVAANLIRPEYYTAADFFADSQTSQAATLFETALAQSRTINNQRGIDSVPPLVRLGECFWEQCDIGMALERYDAALQISMASQRWLALLKPSTGAIRPEARARDMPWAANARGTQMGALGDVWPIALGANDQLLEAVGSQGTGKMLSIDALEILRCQAIALRRRYLLLGPLTKFNPMTGPLLKAFSMNVAGQSEAIQTAMNICRAMAEIGGGDRSVAAQLLTKNLTLPNGLDHPLTAVALLALADLAIDSNEILVAEERAIEASVVAGRVGQMDHLHEAVELIAASGFANGREAAAAKMVQQIVQWSGSKSRLVNIRGHVEIAALAAMGGDIEIATKQGSASTTLLLPKQVVMPRAEATLRYAQAKVAFLEGNIGDGINKLMESILFLRGNEKGIGSPVLYQLDLALALTKSKAIPEPTAELLLGQLLKSPRAGFWRVHALEQLDWLLVDKSEANAMLLDMQLRTQDDAGVVGLLDEARRQRYRRTNELESRVFDLQLLFHSDNRFALNAPEAMQLRKQLPVIEQNATKIQQLLAPLLANPKWDVRKWSEDETRRWESAQRLSATQEAMLWGAAISPLVVSDVFPPRHTQEQLTKSLQPTDAVVLFSSVGANMRGSIYVSGEWKSWEVTDYANLEIKIANFMSQLVASKQRDGELSDAAKGKEQKSKIDLRNQLFPKNVWQLMGSAKRWIIVPDGSIWNLPVEILPSTDQASTLPCIAEHSIIYAPTLGLVPYLLDAKPTSKCTQGVDVHGADFFVAEGSKAKELRDELAAKKRAIVDLSAKSSAYPPSRFFKIASDCVSVYSSMSWDAISPVATDSNPNQSNVRFWGRLPWGSPSAMCLAGVNSLTPTSAMSGDDWLRLTLPLIAQGTRQLTISRWAVGGESTVSLMRTFQENQEDLPVSEAWQRGVLTLWEEQFEGRHEPLFKGTASAKSENTISGSHPLLWSGYLRIGDSK